MRYSIALSALLASTAVARPAVKVVDEIDTITLTVTAGSPQATAYQHQGGQPGGNSFQGQHHGHGHHHHHHPQPAPQPSPAPVPAPAPPSPPQPVSSYQPAPVPAPKPSPSNPSPPAPSPSSPSSGGSGGSGGNDGSPKDGSGTVLDTMNDFRSKYGLNHLTWDDSLAQNALTTGAGGGGVQQIHNIKGIDNCGQVITPGTNVDGSNLQGLTPFGMAMASWLCEVSSDPEISGDCPKVHDVMNMQYDDTGHHDILVDPSYTKCGCGFTANPNAKASSPYKGLWVCTLQK